jgi:diguanylate cyclase (GGDEF)-like protein
VGHVLLLAWAGAILWLLLDYLLVCDTPPPAELPQRRDLLASACFLVLVFTVVAARLLWNAFPSGDRPAARPAEGSVDHLVSAMDHLTEQMHAQLAELSQQAMHDPLTALSNRALFMHSLRRSLARATRQRADVAILYIDLDDFKAVNDTLGHEAGDVLLKTIAQRLQSCLRTEDLAARLGGDEFVVLINEVSGLEEAGAIAERVLKLLGEPLLVSGKLLVPAASVGVAVGGGRGAGNTVSAGSAGSAGENTTGAATQPETLLRDADLAMYRAKGAGKGRYAMFDSRARAASSPADIPPAP